MGPEPKTVRKALALKKESEREAVREYRQLMADYQERHNELIEAQNTLAKAMLSLSKTEFNVKTGTIYAPFWKQPSSYISMCALFVSIFSLWRD